MSNKAIKLIELTKGQKRVLVTLWEGGNVASCVTEEQKQSCETCEGNEELCAGYVEHLKAQGFEAVEYNVAELEKELSLPTFLAQQPPKDIALPQESISVQGVEDVEPGTVEEVSGGSGEVPPGEEGGGGPDTV